MAGQFSSSKLPVIYQTEVTECGLACVAMIARFHGHDIDLNGLRKQFPVSMMGATLKSLIGTAHQLDLGARALRLDMDDLGNLKLPAILHWDMNHFVVLKKVAGDKIHIHDPARGPRVLRRSIVSEHFTGVALELSPLTDFTPITNKDEMKISHLWDRLVGWKRATLQLLALSIMLQVLILAAPFYLQLAVDEAIDRFDPDFLLLLALAFGGLAIIQVATKMLREWVILHFGYQMSFQMVSNIFRHLVHLPTAFFEKRHIGDILSRMRSTTPIQTALTQSVVAAIIDGLMAVITGIVIFIYSPVLGMIVLISVVLLLIFTFAFYPVLRSAQEEMIINEALEATHRIETIRASTAIKLFSAESQRMSVWRNLYVDFVNAGITHGKYGVFQRAIQDLINLVQIVLVVYFGAKLAMPDNSAFTVGMLFAFMAYRQSFTDSIISLFNKFIEFKLLSLHLERIADIAQAEPEIASGAAAWNPAGTVKGKIEIKDLSFRYSSTDPWVLENLNLTIEAGAFVALTGPSGAGKTTLMKLILGLYAPTKGEILIDGQKLDASNRGAWRQHIGVVMQDDKLLSGSVAENISFFDPQIDMKRVAKAASQAKIHDEINAMPMGYESMIGDMGSVLSGGQKQRVLLARALYKNPQALFLDEGTANLDRDTEKLIVGIIKKMKMTRVIVAHRQEFLKRVDAVVVVE